ncbi:MAG TPA: serine/threonine-protein kinase [Pirellulaceae bacterium]|nr:serine/threonine-protein kinase [Pirellulaceae bacterium]
MEHSASTPCQLHPSADELADFSAGKIMDESRCQEIEAHLQSCEACGHALLKPLKDGLADKLARYVKDEIESTDTPKYEILDELGRGGIGVVYRARQAGLNRTLAIKFLMSGARANSAEIARFRREALVLGRLDHPSIVRIHDAGERAGVPFLAMEFVDGPSLSKRLAGEPIAPRIAARWLRDLAQAVDYAHRCDVLHRDIKPHNVLLARSDTNNKTSPISRIASQADLKSPADVDHDSVPKLVDFGLARLEGMDAFQTRTGETLGTPAYMAPEMLNASADALASPAVDIYGLGTVLYECLVGRPPYAGTHGEVLAALMNSEPIAVQLLRPAVPRDLATICPRCLARQPTKRFATAGELRDDLQRFLDGIPIRSRPVGTMERMLSWARRNPWRGLAAGLLMVLLAAVPLGLFLHGRKLEHQRALANSQYETARNTVWKMLGLLESSDANRVKELSDLYQRQTETALEMFEQLAEADGSEHARLEYIRALIQAGTLSIATGRRDRAWPQLEKASSLCRAMLQGSFGTDAQEQLAIALTKMAWLPKPDDPASEVRCLVEATNIYRELTRRRPDHFSYRSGLSWSLHNLGSAKQRCGELEQALPLLRESLEILASFTDADVDPIANRISMAETRINIGSILSATGETDQARDFLLRAVSELDELYRDHPEKCLELAVPRAAALLNYSNALGAADDFAAAVDVCRQGREHVTAALGLDSSLQQLTEYRFLLSANEAHYAGLNKEYAAAAIAWSRAIEWAQDESTRVYCSQMRIRCLVGDQQFLTAANECSIIDVIGLEPIDTFRQASCWALIANSTQAASDSSDDSSADSSLAEVAITQAVKLLERLSTEGQLSADLKCHLRESEDWKTLRASVSATQWSSWVGN